MRFRLLLISFLFLGLGSLFAQSTKRGSDSYTFTYSADEYTRAQAIDKAIKDAKIELLTITFGTDLQMDTYTRVENSQGAAKVDISARKEEHLRGVWVETTSEQTEVGFDPNQNRWVVKVRIAGVMREKKNDHTRPEFVVKTLSAPHLNAETTIIPSAKDIGDKNFFLYFKSPVDGYLAAYLVDMSGTAVRILPYRMHTEQKIQPRLEYIFYNTHASMHSDDYTFEIDGITLTCDDVAEHYKLYTIFSPHHFTIPMDDASGGLPVLTESDLRKWLDKSQRADDAFYVTPIDITIKK